MENKADAQPSHGETAFWAPGPLQTVHESGEHFTVGKADTRLHGESGGSGKAPYEKGGEPPVSLGIADTLVLTFAEPEGAIQHFVVFGAGEPGGFVVAFRDNGICVVDADFRAGIDTVLSFPEFNQPGSATVIEIDRERIENHLKAGRQIVIEPGVSGLSLRRVHCGGKESAVTVKIVTEGVYQFVQKGTFGTVIHGIDFADDLFAAALKEDTAKKGC